jgi:RimJ/RimL family protein N-acetyltransferase
MEVLPLFTTDRLFLKGISEQDTTSYKKHFIDYDVIQYLSNQVSWPYPENGVEEFIKNVILPNQNKNRWAWGIFLKENPNELIGCIDLWREGKPENRGFWLGKLFWNKGIMTEANYPVLNYAFHNLAFEKLVFANAVGNFASRKVKEKTGCSLIKVQPAQFVNQKFTHQEIWELTKEHWLLYTKEKLNL